jgi:drug/metabolite transporter (DMT)-like permease
MFIKIAVVEVPPVYLALGRIALGALTLVVFLAVLNWRATPPQNPLRRAPAVLNWRATPPQNPRRPFPRDRRLWLHLFVFAIFGSTVPFIMFGYAEERVSSVLAGIWNGTVPLTTLVVTLLIVRFAQSGRGERPSRQQVAGLLLGFLGVLIVLGVWHGVGGSSLVGQFQLLVAVSCYGVAMNYSRRIMTRWTISPLQLSAGQTLMSTLQLLIVAPLIAGAPPAPSSLSLGVLGSIAALGVLGTGVAFALNFHVIRTAGVTTGSMVTYLPPVVAAVVGVVLLREHLTWNQPLGGIIVLAGVGISQGMLARLRKAGPRPRDR